MSQNSFVSNRPNVTPWRWFHYSFAVVSILALAGLAAWHAPRADQVADVKVYEKIAGAVSEGTLPLESEYPPLVTASFFGVSKDHGGLPFGAAWVWHMLIVVVTATGFSFWRRHRGAPYLPAALLLSGILFGAEFVFSRYDVLVLVAIYLALQEAIERRPQHAAGWLAIATGLKFVPALLIPILVLTVPRTEWKKTLLGALVGGLLVTALPLVVLGWNGTMTNLSYMATYHGERGVQIESTWSAAEMLAKNVTGRKIAAKFHNGATHNDDLGPNVALTSSITVIIGLALIYWVLRRSARSGVPLAEKQTEWWSAALLWAVAAAPVFSPQYLVWSLPLLFVSWFGRGFKSAEDRRFLLLTLLIGGLTAWIYPYHNARLTSGADLPVTIVLMLRNAIVLLLAWLLLNRARRAPGVPEPATMLPAWCTRTAETFRSPLATKWLTGLMVALMVSFVVAICSFKILDRDFWWHVTAGKIMVTEHRWIETDPFAYAREGMEYISTHEWLAQVVLYLVMQHGGVMGVTVFRMFMIALAAGFVLAIDRKRLWPNVFIAMYAVNVARPGFMDRPQLFTFALISAFVWLSYHILDDDRAGQGEHGSRRENLLWLFIPLEILWVNFHGGAALVGIGIVGAIFVQRLADWAFAATPQERAQIGHGVRRAATISALTALCFLATPDGWGNISFLIQLLTDKTAQFISEWKPREFGQYIADYAVVWIVGLWAIGARRKNAVFSTIVFLATGYLSFKAFRHEMLFAFAAAGIIIYQLKHATAWDRALAWVRARPATFIFLTLAVGGLVIGNTAQHFQRFAARDHLYGYGKFDLAKGAADFLDREQVSGKMFNTYGIGGYMIYRSYPDRKVFIDGRNVDYGFDYLGRALVAQKDEKAWKSLEDKYGFTYAVIDYDAIREPLGYPFVDHLGKNPKWRLAYLDDWTAVYLKDVPENAALIARLTYSQVTPQSLTGGMLAESVKPEALAVTKAELERIARDNADGIKARLALAQLANAAKDYVTAEAEARQGLATQPLRPTLRYELGRALAGQSRWPEAAREFRLAALLSLDRFSDKEFRSMIDASEKAGQDVQAQWIRTLGDTKPAFNVLDKMPDLGVQNESTQALAQNLLAQLRGSQSNEVQRLLDEGIRFAQAKEADKALEAFQKVLKIDPKNAAALSNITGALLLQKKYVEAETYGWQAIAADDTLPDGHYNLALALIGQKKYEEALTEARRAQELGKDTGKMIKGLEMMTAKK